MWIRMLVSTTRGYSRGKEYEVTSELGKDLCKAGHAEAIAKPASAKKETRKKTPAKKKTAKK